ncbi:hypothetical protein CAPTEDRAFT_160280 [Capitella teleta]|uniref:SAM domain-containing protein n=1 Tax=Capitella teleta TaxID=283909 RepID=R7UDX4_CAPTE|nr:hypothetical protein CAPTEDRAFT_160280 [Capitella teleta]|eukprot:ELU04194.1 hypothetical protein CAPTEDRAFT_160280 [Capitella teleta]
MFRDQVGLVANWFNSWNACEQTVAVYSLLRKIPATQSKFLLQVLTSSVQTDTNDLVQLEAEANDPVYVSNMLKESKDEAVARLLRCLPLLRAGNTQAKAAYTKIMPLILHHSIEQGCHIEESRQLLSYWLIHPALSTAERGRFTLWLSHLEERCSSAHHAAASGESENLDNKVTANWTERLNSAADCEGAAGSAAGPQHRPITNNNVFSPELPSPHLPLHSTLSGVSAVRFCLRSLFICLFTDVPVWLKSLRLHKYSMLFQTMKYDDMMELSEEYLESQNVTKGARNKIILSIKKLKLRQPELRAMEKEIMDSGNLKQALQELKAMLNTPIKRFVPPVDQKEAVTSEGEGNIAEGDLPGQITRVLGKFCTQLLIGMGRLEDECYNHYLQLLDRCNSHEAFLDEQKKKLLSWKQQIQKIWQPPATKYTLDRHRKLFAQQPAFPVHWLRQQQQQQRPPLRGNPQILQKQPKWTFNGRPPVPSAVMAANLSNMTGPAVGLSPAALYRNNSFNAAFTHRPVMEVKQPVTRTHSAPMRTSQYPIGLHPRPAVEVTSDEVTEVDALCSSMAKHALGSFGESLW